MTAKSGTERFSLSRWSRRKLATAIEAPAPPPTSAPATAPAPATALSVPPAPVELPPVESLTFDSDFTAFLRPGVDDKVKRAALKQLFRDPRFNVMDGLDTYIDDYTKADPIPPDMLADLLQRGFGPAPETGQEQAAAVNAPPEEPAVTGATQPAISAGGEHAATPPHAALSPARDGEGEQAKRSADEGDIARADDSAGAGGVHRQR
jgi:uncharacterized protein DUF3306